jgi:hypothetical protein
MTKVVVAAFAVGVAAIVSTNATTSTSVPVAAPALWPDIRVAAIRFSSKWL